MLRARSVQPYTGAPAARVVESLLRARGRRPIAGILAPPGAPEPGVSSSRPWSDLEARPGEEAETMPDRYCVGPSMATDWGDDRPALSWCLARRVLAYFRPYWRG